MATKRCESICYMLDERWGRLPNHCELNHGHDGDHRAALDACEPVAYLQWHEEAC